MTKVKYNGWLISINNLIKESRLTQAERDMFVEGVKYLIDNNPFNNEKEEDNQDGNRKTES